MAIGEKLKQARLSKNYTQDFMADVLNISQKTYSNFENNKTVPDFSQIEQMAGILEISVLDFLTNEKVSFYQTTEKGSNNGLIFNSLSDKVVEQYELRIKRLEEETLYLKGLLKNFMNK